MSGAPSRRALPLLLVAVPPDTGEHIYALTDDPRVSHHYVHTGRHALRELHRLRPDLLLLSTRLRDPGPWDTLERVRQLTDELRVIALDRTYREKVALRALEAGADDYMWPGLSDAFTRALVLARLRRAFPVTPPPGLLVDPYLTLDVAHHEATAAGLHLPLTPLEFNVLLALVRNPRQVLTPEQLMGLAWKNLAEDDDPAKVRYVVRRLRRRFEETTGGPAPIETVRGVGYRYRPPSPA
ncbi:response regulator transcription factor [Streptomyces sp. NPDC050418]|uniref:response regulator transcription factor n=1 Tax=Streptomyces sp. NPDC050418 TaxID=3365612 RepID=UPI0037AF1B4F